MTWWKDVDSFGMYRIALSTDVQGDNYSEPVTNNFCILPWTHFTVGSSGDVSLCCHNMQIEDIAGDVHDNLFGKVADKINNQYAGNVKSDKVEDIWNSSYFKDARKSMLAGKKHWACSKCWREEEGGVVSDRMLLNSQVNSSEDFDHYINNTTSDGHLNIQPQSIRFALGNVCNLQCQMCGPAYSSSWASMLTRLSKKEGFEIPKEWSDPTIYDWARKPLVWSEQFYPLMEYTRHMFLLGGEPFLVPQHYDLLRYCVDNNYSKNIYLRYNTNCTIPISSKVLDLWAQFKFVDLEMSVDSMEERNDYIRYPSKWETIQKFFEFVDRETPENIGANIFPTVSTTNVYYIPEFLDWVNAQEFNKINRAYGETPYDLYLNLVHIAPHNNIQCLPSDAKKTVEQKYNSWYDTHSDLKHSVEYKGIKVGSVRVMSLIEFMNKEDLSQHYPQFVHSHMELDRIRGTDFYKTFPIFKEFDK